MNPNIQFFFEKYSTDDLIAINALIRPGVGDFNEYIARRNGKKYTIHKDREWYISSVLQEFSK